MKTLLPLLVFILLCTAGCNPHKRVSVRTFHNAVEKWLDAYCSPDPYAAAEALNQHVHLLMRWERLGVENLDFDLLLEQAYARLYMIYLHLGKEPKAHQCFLRLTERLKRKGTPSEDITTNNIPGYVASIDRLMDVQWKDNVNKEP